MFAWVWVLYCCLFDFGLFWFGFNNVVYGYFFAGGVFAVFIGFVVCLMW